MIRKGALVLLAACLIGPSVANAGEQNLEFDLVYKRIESKTVQVPNVENQSLTEGSAFGVAVFKDGRYAVKDFVFLADASKDSGTQSGYSTYTFDDGSTLTLSWTAAYRPGQPYRGDYKILSGTGTYAGAIGSGTFERAASKLKDVTVLKVKIHVRTPIANAP